MSVTQEITFWMKSHSLFIDEWNICRYSWASLKPVWTWSFRDLYNYVLGLIHSCESSHSLYHLAHFLSCIISQSPALCSSNYNAKLHFPCLRLNGADAVIFTWLETPMDAQTNTLTIMMSSIDKLTCFLCTKCHTLGKPRVKTGL